MLMLFLATPLQGMKEVQAYATNKWSSSIKSIKYVIFFKPQRENPAAWRQHMTNSYLFIFVLRGRLPFFFSVSVINGDVFPTHILTTVLFFFAAQNELIFSIGIPDDVPFQRERCVRETEREREKGKTLVIAITYSICARMATWKSVKQDVANC